MHSWCPWSCHKCAPELMGKYLSNIHLQQAADPSLISQISLSKALEKSAEHGKSLTLLANQNLVCFITHTVVLLDERQGDFILTFRKYPKVNTRADWLSKQRQLRNLKSSNCWGWGSYPVSFRHFLDKYLSANCINSQQSAVQPFSSLARVIFVGLSFSSDTQGVQRSQFILQGLGREGRLPG